METKDTIAAIKTMTKTMREYADSFDRLAKRMEESGDLSYAGEVAGGVANLIQNLRLDLLVTRPLREYEREQVRAKYNLDLGGDE